MPAAQACSHNSRPREANVGAASRRLIYFPIIHTQADMGALKDSVVRATLQKLGRVGLDRHMTVIDKTWSEIETCLEDLALPFDRIRLYQDGLPVSGREEEIVAELARKGNRNHQLLLRLMECGAQLMGTESADLLVQEYRQVKQALGARPPRAAGVAAQRQALSQDLLQRRDRFIAARINVTLKPGETGILFLGMLHAVEPYLEKDVQVIYPLHRPHRTRRKI